jgi:hypothetical protein
MIKPTISNITWTNANYYGAGRTVTLSFQTDMPGLDYLINTTSSNLTLTKTSVSVNTVTMTFTTTTWSDPASVMITANGLDVQQIVGPTRNIIKFGKLTLRRNNSNVDSDNITITYNNKSVKTGVKSSELTTGGYELDLPGVREEDLDKQITFSYPRNNGSTRSASASISDIMEGGKTLNFY